MIKRGLALTLVLGLASIAQADVDIKLAPDCCLPDETLDFTVSLSQDSGADVYLRMVGLFTYETAAEFTVGPFAWDAAFGTNHYQDVAQPGLAAAYLGLTTNSAEQVLLPADGSYVEVGTLQITCPHVESTRQLNVLRANGAADDSKSVVSYGFGVAAGDDVTYVRPGAGLTGGVLMVNITPECGDDKIIFESAWPADQTNLWRTQNNYALLTFDNDIPAAPVAGEIAIRELLAGGAYGPDLSANFTFTIDPSDAKTLIVQEVGANLTHNKWFGIENVSWDDAEWFEVQYRVLMGDVDNNGRVLALDAGAIYPSVPCVNITMPCWNPRKDIDGNNKILALDAGAVYPRVPSIGVAKPAGH